MENNTFITTLDLQSRLFNNVTDGIDGKHDTTRLQNANHFSWLAGHLVSTRHMLGNLLGLQNPEKYAALYSNRKGLQENETYPHLTDLKTEWKNITEAVRPRLNALTKEELASPAPFQTPVADNTFSGFLNFIMHHEAYHIGQMGLLRRQLGYPAMAY